MPISPVRLATAYAGGGNGQHRFLWRAHHGFYCQSGGGIGGGNLASGTCGLMLDGLKFAKRAAKLAAFVDVINREFQHRPQRPGDLQRPQRATTGDQWRPRARHRNGGGIDVQIVAGMPGQIAGLRSNRPALLKPHKPVAFHLDHQRGRLAPPRNP